MLAGTGQETCVREAGDVENDKEWQTLAEGGWFLLKGVACCPLHHIEVWAKSTSFSTLPPPKKKNDSFYIFVNSSDF